MEYLVRVENGEIVDGPRLLEALTPALEAKGWRSTNYGTYDPALHTLGPATILVDRVDYEITPISAETLLTTARQAAITEIKRLRDQALVRFNGNSGRAMIYDENYYAAVEYLAGRGATSVTKDGQTCAAYLNGLGQRMRKTVQEFAAHVIAENRASGPTAYQGEARYLAHVYGGDTDAGIVAIPDLVDIPTIEAQPELYRQFCGL